MDVVIAPIHGVHAGNHNHMAAAPVSRARSRGSRDGACCPTQTYDAEHCPVTACLGHLNAGRCLPCGRAVECTTAGADDEQQVQLTQGSDRF
jgi:hypothetical protein